MTRRRLTEAEVRAKIRAFLRSDLLYDDTDLRDSDFEIRRLTDSPDRANWTVTVVHGDPERIASGQAAAIARSAAKVQELFDLDWGL